MNTLTASLLLASSDLPVKEWPPFSDAVWQILLVVFLVLLNGFFVAAEFAIVKVRATQIEQLLDEGQPKAKRAARRLWRTSPPCTAWCRSLNGEKLSRRHG